MSLTSDTFENIGKAQQERLASTSALYTDGLKEIGSETANYIKQATDDTTAVFEKLISTKSFDEAKEIQSNYAKSQWANLIAQNKRVGELYHGIVSKTLEAHKASASL